MSEATAAVKLSIVIRDIQQDRSRELPSSIHFLSSAGFVECLQRLHKHHDGGWWERELKEALNRVANSTDTT
jgi:hypothetical protein